MAETTKPLSKSELMTGIAADTGLTKKEIAGVFDSLEGHIKQSLAQTGPGAFVVPGLMKIEKKNVPARPARYGVPNPFKPGELMDIPAKPATTKIKVRPLKALKAM